MWLQAAHWLVTHPGEVATLVVAVLSSARALLEFLTARRRKDQKRDPESERRRYTDLLTERLVQLRAENRKLRAELKARPLADRRKPQEPTP